MESKPSSQNQKQKKTRHAFLHTFFDNPNEYSEIEVNGFVLINQWNGNSKSWDVAIYPKSSFLRKQYFMKGIKKAGNKPQPMARVSDQV